MKRGFLCIAVGSPNYGNMALSLCLSIRANDNYPVMLVCTESAIKGIESQVNKYFAHVEIVSDNDMASMQLASCLKVNAYNYATKYFDETIILDADTLILPGKSLKSWFEQKQDFVAYYHAVYDYKTGKADKENAMFWLDPEKVRDYDMAVKKLPQINASFIYFRKSDLACKIFDTAARVMVDPDAPKTFNLKLFRGFVNEEPCFNLACAFFDVAIDMVPYRPLYLQVFSETIDVDHIQHKFKAFSLAGDIIHDPKVVSLYNRLSDYYRKEFGIRDRFHFFAPGKAGHNKAYEVDKTVFVPQKKENFVASIYLTGSKMNWNNFPESPNIKSLENWAFSLKKTGLKGILFHNCFTKEDIQTFSSYPVEFSYAEMPAGQNSGLYRFELYNQFMKTYPLFIDGIFFTDSTDVEILRNPFEDKKFDTQKIYIGVEENILDSFDLRNMAKTVPEYLELANDPIFGKNRLLNAGCVGGNGFTVAPFIEKMAEWCSKFHNLALFQDMPIINALAYTKFRNKISYGPHVTTIFARWEKDNKVAWIKHK